MEIRGRPALKCKTDAWRVGSAYYLVTHTIPNGYTMWAAFSRRMRSADGDLYPPQVGPAHRMPRGPGWLAKVSGNLGSRDINY